MKRHAAILVMCIALIVLGISIVARADDFKNFRPSGYVTDRAGIINSATKTQLEALCTELEQKTGAQLAVVTVKSLDGNEIQPYANDLFKQLGIGNAKKKEDNGVMLLVAPNDRKYWTEVGYGLEPVINDARAGDAGRLLVPFFRQGDYSGGILAASAQLAKYIADDKGVTLTGMPQLPPVHRREDVSFHGIWILIILGYLAFSVFRSAIRNTSGRGGGGGAGTGLLIGAILGSMGRGGGGGWGGGGGGGWGGGGGGFGGFGGGASGGGGAGGSW